MSVSFCVGGGLSAVLVYVAGDCWRGMMRCVYNVSVITSRGIRRWNGIMIGKAGLAGMWRQSYGLLGNRTATPRPDWANREFRLK